MKYREARNLKKGDRLIRISDGQILIVNSIEFLGGLKMVRIFCTDHENKDVTVYSVEVKIADAKS